MTPDLLASTAAAVAPADGAAMDGSGAPGNAAVTGDDESVEILTGTKRATDSGNSEASALGETTPTPNQGKQKGKKAKLADYVGDDAAGESGRRARGRGRGLGRGSAKAKADSKTSTGATEDPTLSEDEKPLANIQLQCAADANKPAAKAKFAPRATTTTAVARRQAKQEKESDEEPAPQSGAPDERKTSRAQRHVFNLSLSSCPQEVQTQYYHLVDKNTKLPGKQKQINAIINAWVPRNATYGASLQKVDTTVSRVSQFSLQETAGFTNTGMGKYVMIGSLFAGHRELFDAAHEAGEIWEDDDGLWYHHAKTKGKQAHKNELVDVARNWSVEDESKLGECFKILQLEMCEEKGAWLDKIDCFAGPSGSAGSSDSHQQALADTNGMATDEDYLLLQLSFDSVTRVTAALRNISMQVRSLPSTQVLGELVNKAVNLCKEVVPSQTAIEELLLSDRSLVTKKTAKAALAESAQPYRNLLTFHNELVALANFHITQENEDGVPIKMRPKFKPLSIAPPEKKKGPCKKEMRNQE